MADGGHDALCAGTSARSRGHRVEQGRTLRTRVRTEALATAATRKKGSWPPSARRVHLVRAASGAWPTSAMRGIDGSSWDTSPMRFQLARDLGARATSPMRAYSTWSMRCPRSTAVRAPECVPGYALGQPNGNQVSTGRTRLPRILDRVPGAPVTR